MLKTGKLRVYVPDRWATLLVDTDFNKPSPAAEFIAGSSQWGTMRWVSDRGEPIGGYSKKNWQRPD